MSAFSRLGFARQFQIASFFVLVTGMLIIGKWVERQIEIGVVNRTASVTALYVDSFIAQHLQDLAHTNRLSAEHISSLDMLLNDTPLGERIVAFKVWGPDGTVLYSTNPALLGRTFPVTDPLRIAFSGGVHTEISTLEEPENELERQNWSRLIETYAPVRIASTGAIVAVSEFYQTTDELEREVNTARFQSWLLVGAATLLMYVGLAGWVGKAGNTILAQQNELHEKVLQLTVLLNQNEQLHDRVRRAASRTTTLNERYLRRVAADLHDGPGQDISLALLRIDELAVVCATCNALRAKRRSINNDFGTIQSALRSALQDMRAILAGLRLPEIGELTLAETVRRAIRDFERKSSVRISLTMDDFTDEIALSIKITIYRILQESLANSFRHASGSRQKVSIIRRDDHLIVTVSDDGPGFDQQANLFETHLGLVGIRERVEILGGIFELDSVPGKGTTVRAQLPLTVPEAVNE